MRRPNAATHPQLSSRRSWSFGGPTVLCAVGSAVVVVCLYFLAWWPSDFEETRFLDVRRDFTSSGSGNWFDVFWTSFYSVAAIVWSRAKNAADA